MTSPHSQSACRHHRLGACLLEEHNNPGLDKKFACLRLLRLQGDFDVFVDRAEAFNLSEREAAHIWNGRRQPALEEPGLCPHPHAASIGKSPCGRLDCSYLYDLACILRLPRCSRPCEFFSLPAEK